MTIERELSDEEIQRLWIEEALRRDAEMDSGTASSRDAEDVFRDAQARISSRFSTNGQSIILKGQEKV